MTSFLVMHKLCKINTTFQYAAKGSDRVNALEKIEKVDKDIYNDLQSEPEVLQSIGGDITALIDIDEPMKLLDIATKYPHILIPYRALIDNMAKSYAGQIGCHSVLNGNKYSEIHEVIGSITSDQADSLMDLVVWHYLKLCVDSLCDDNPAAQIFPEEMSDDLNDDDPSSAAAAATSDKNEEDAAVSAFASAAPNPSNPFDLSNLAKVVDLDPA